MENKGYISEWLNEYLGGKTPEEAGLSEEDVKRLIACYEGGKDPNAFHLSSYNECACNICRS